MVKPITSMQPSSCRCGSKSWCSLGFPHGMVPAQYLVHTHSYVPNLAYSLHYNSVIYNSFPHWGCSPRNVEEHQTLQLQILNLWGEIGAVALMRGDRQIDRRLHYCTQTHSDHSWKRSHMANKMYPLKGATFWLTDSEEEHICQSNEMWSLQPTYYTSSEWSLGSQTGVNFYFCTNYFYYEVGNSC